MISNYGAEDILFYSILLDYAGPRDSAKDFVFYAKSIDLSKNPNVDEVK